MVLHQSDVLGRLLELTIMAFRLGNTYVGNVMPTQTSHRRCDRCQLVKKLDELVEGSVEGKIFYQAIPYSLPSGLIDYEIHKKDSRQKVSYCKSCVSETKMRPNPVELPKNWRHPDKGTLTSVEIQDLHLNHEYKKRHDPANDLPFVVSLEDISKAH